MSIQVFLTLLASSNTVLRHVFLGLPLPHLPWDFHCRACLTISSDSFHSVWPSHPHLRFLICKSVLGCFVHFIFYMVWPENSQYFPEAFINKAMAVTNINGYLFVDFITRNPK